MKKLTLLSILFLFAVNFSMAINPSGMTHHRKLSIHDPQVLQGMNIATMSLKEFQKITGKKLSFKEKIKYRLAQKAMKIKSKKSGGQFPTVLYVVLSILPLAWILMGVQDDWQGNKWWVNLILYIIMWLPGFIHSMVKMKEYTND